MMRQLTTLISGPALPRISLWMAMIVLLLMPVYPFLTTWLGSIIGYPLVLKASKDVALVLMAVALLAWVVIDSTRRHQASRDVICWLILSLVVIGFLVTAWANPGLEQSTMAGLLSTGRYLAMFWLVYISVRYGGAGFAAKDKILPTLGWIGVGLALLGALQVFVLPLDTLERFGYDKDTTIAPYVVIDDNMDAPRAFATLRGPNDYAAYLLITALAATLLARRDRRWLMAVGLIVFALVLSSSRSAWLGLVAALGVLMLVVYSASSAPVKKLMRLGSLVVVVIGLITLMAATTVPALRLAIFHSSPDDTHLTEGSTEEHWIATGKGVQRAIDQPMGCGIGCAGPASFYSDSPKISENYFIQIAEEIGIIGLLAWMALFIVVMRRLWRQRTDELSLLVFLAGIGLSVVGVWLHVWYDDPVALTWWALAGLVVGSAGRSQQKPLE